MGGIDIGQTSLTPAGAPGPSLNGWQWSSVPGPWWAAMMARADIDTTGNPIPVSPFNAAFQALIASIPLGPNIRSSWYGNEPDATGSNYGNTSQGMPFNQIRGDTPTQAITYWEYPANSDAGPIPLLPAMSIEAWPFGSPNADNLVTGTVTVTNGSPNVTGQGGSNFTAKLAAGDQVSFGTPMTTILYTVKSVTSDAALVLGTPGGASTNYNETTASGIEIYGPFNRPPTYVQVQALAGDSRALILVRNEAGGLPAKLWEVWYPSYDVSPGWQGGAAAYFDLTTGAQRPDGWTSDTAGGTPCMPFLVRYEECLAGAVNHPLRGVVHRDIALYNRCIFPATHAANTFAAGLDYTQGPIPTGGVLRLNAAWLAVNLSSFPPIIQPILTAMNKYGLHVNDYTTGTPWEIDGSQDSRWKKSDLQTLWTIPATAFEVIDTIKPQYTITPSAGPYTTGTAITFTIAYTGGNNTNFGPIRVHVQYSLNGGTVTDSGAYVDLSNSTLSGTCSWTPGSGGNYLLNGYQASGVYWIDPPQISLAVSASTRSLTSIAAARWDAYATWGATPPTAGDSATVAHAIIAVGDVSLGTGAATTCLTIGLTGSLTMIGCKLTIRGNASIGAYNAGNVLNYLTVFSSAGNAGAIWLDGNSGVTPVIMVNTDSQITLTGYQGHPVTVGTLTGTAGQPGYITGSGARSFYINASYFVFSNLGGPAQAGLVSSHIDDATTANPPFILDHGTITNCGQLSLGVSGTTVNFQITNCVWTTLADANGYPYSISTGNALTTGTRLYARNVTPEGQGLAQFGYSQGITFDNNFFGSLLFAQNSQPPWTVLQNSFLYQSTNYGGADTTETNGNINNCFVLAGTTGTPTMLYLSCCNVAGCVHSNNVFQSALTTGDRSEGCIGTGEEGSQTHTVAAYGNIVLPNFGGGWSGTLITNFNNPTQSFVVNCPVEHNTQFIGPSTSAAALCGIIADGAPPGERVNEIQDFRANLIVRTGTGAGSNCYAVMNYIADNPVTDALASANTDYNGYTSLDTVPSGRWSTITGSGGEVGSVYNTPMSTAPGSHDVALGTSANLATSGPQFVDPTRGLLQFDTYMGGPGTLAHAIQSLKAQYDPTNGNYITGYTNIALLAWIKAGWRPQNAALKQSGWSGDTSTADAAGNPWPGTTPGIGAMGWI